MCCCSLFSSALVHFEFWINITSSSATVSPLQKIMILIQNATQKSQALSYAVDYYLFKYPTGSMKLLIIELYHLSIEITGFSIFLSREWVGQLEARNEFLHDLSRWDNDGHPKPMKSLTQHDIFLMFPWPTVVIIVQYYCNLNDPNNTRAQSRDHKTTTHN